MAVENREMANLMKGVFENSLRFYRRTFKRFRIVHTNLHRLMSRLVIPLLERMTDFYTMPDDPLWFRLELLGRRHEVETVRHIEARIKDGMTILDIGAHVGYYARLTAKRAGLNGRVVAFEPHPRTYQMLKRNVARFPNIITVQAAVAEQAGTAELYDYLMMSASGSLHYDESLRHLQQAQLQATDIAPRIGDDFTMEKYTVQTLTVDSVLNTLGIKRVDMIKMDIEGAEISALRGMRETLARSPGAQLVMEYNPTALKTFGHDPVAALDEVLGLGFKQVHAIELDGTLTEWTGKHGLIAERTAQLMTHMGVVNLLFS